MSDTLVDFLNHGVLPFIGRTAEIERIISLWEGSAELQELRAILLTGEAGIGKSRLVEELAPRIAAAGGLVLCARIYPESTTALAPIIAQALRHSTEVRPQVTNASDESLPSVIATLRRLGRLRPLLLVIEDIHLLDGPASIQELSRLLAALSDEPLPVLLLSRPIDIRLRGVLERYMVEEIEMPPLSADEIETIWSTIFHVRAEPTSVAALYDATLGNPLAVRSALRGGIASGALARHPIDGDWRPTVGIDELAYALKHNVTLWSAGMAAHLSNHEIETATQLARLGEVFSREAAGLIVPNLETTLERLMFKGVIAPASIATPLAGGPSIHPPLAFTHTVLHRHLLEQGVAEGTALISIIATALPLYSVVPFKLLATEKYPCALPPATIEQAIQRSIELARMLDARPDWRLAGEVVHCADALLDSHRDLWSAQEWQHLRCVVLSGHLVVQSRGAAPDLLNRYEQELLELTAPPTPENLLEARLLALFFLADINLNDADIFISAWQQVKDLTRANPHLYFTIRYLQFMEASASWAQQMPDRIMIEGIEASINSLMNAPEASSDFRRFARHILALSFQSLFNTPEELELRRRRLTELERYIDPKRRMSYLYHRINLAVAIGEYNEVLTVSAVAIPLFQERELHSNLAFARISCLGARAAAGIPISRLILEVEELVAALPERMRDRSKILARLSMIEMAILQGDSGWLAGIREEYFDAWRYLRPEAQIVLHYEEGYPLDYLASVASVASDGFAPLIALALDPQSLALQQAMEIIETFLTKEPLRINDTIERRAALGIARALFAAGADAPIPTAQRTMLSQRLESTIEWLGSRQLRLFILPFIERYADLLLDATREAWGLRSVALAEQQRAAHDNSHPSIQRHRLSVLGTMQMHDADGNVIAIRGARARTLMGLLVADKLLEQPLAHHEFATIMSDIDSDTDRARRSLNSVVFRVREMIGHDLILTDGETPRLNLARVEVDLLDVVALIRTASVSLHDRLLSSALAFLTRALDLLGGEVPFPALYSRFFDAARDDFEYELRALVAGTARALLDEDDAAAAESLLRAGVAAIPNNDMLVELLGEALIRVGRRVEAERLLIGKRGRA